MSRYHATGGSIFNVSEFYPVRGWPDPTLPLPAKCDYCGRDGGVNFVCDGCGAPRQARGESARVDRGYVTAATMGEPSVIIEGVDSPSSGPLLCSTVHGAGRALSRTAAAGKFKVTKAWQCGMRECGRSLPARELSRGPQGELPRCPDCGNRMHIRHERTVVRPGLVDWPMVQAAVRVAGIELRGAGADEAPECYKRLPDVLAAQGDTIRVLHTLTPVGVAMAGPDVADPYKD